MKKKFRIESCDAFKEVIEKEWFMMCFDLRSAYHHIQLEESYWWKYFGFCAEMKGEKKYFAFVCLPFGFSDSARVLTKVLRHVI